MARFLLRACGFVLVGSLVSCEGEIGGQPSGDPEEMQQPVPKPGSPNPTGTPPPPPFQPLPAQVNVAKVKTLLTGQPVTDDELRAVIADKNALKGLIDTWLKMPESQDIFLRFFKQAFQQTQTDTNDYTDILSGANINGWPDRAAFLRSAEEMFARTALKLMEEGRPFTEVATTDRFMLNPPLMAALSYIDTVPRDDNNAVVGVQVWPVTKFGGVNFALNIITNIDPTTTVATPIPFEETINPASANFMKFFVPKAYTGTTPRCVEPYVAKGVSGVQAMFEMIFGMRPGGCGGSNTNQWTAADWADWRMVRVRAPRAGEDKTLFWEVAKLRDPKTVELVTDTPRVGFMSTLSFFANWPTNLSNGSRVTTNQALIVGLGRSFDDKSTTVQVAETSSDALHIKEGTTCFACHRTLDPMRDFFRQSYSITYFKQLNPRNPKNPIPAVGTFDVGVEAPTSGSGISMFAQAMAKNPLFAPAWTQKMCFFANSSPCVETDPEFLRVAAVFRDSRFNFKTLVRELFASPLVTFAATTQTARENGVIMSIARRESLCNSLAARLKLPNVCGLEAGGKTNFRNLAMSIPGAGYNRAEEVPLMPHDPNLFFISATENLCNLIAPLVVDAGAVTRYASTRKDEAIADFVATVMGMPPADTRAATMRQILSEHYDMAVAAKATARDALRSTFIAACTSPPAISLGL